MHLVFKTDLFKTFFKVIIFEMSRLPCEIDSQYIFLGVFVHPTGLNT